METIDWSKLPLLDLAGRRADLPPLVRDKNLLIFLRHLA